MPLLSIVIPSVGKPSLKVLLDSILKQNKINECEVIVVFNNIENIRIPHNFPQSSQIRFLKSDSGVNKARNLGIKEAQGRWLYFLDDDVELPSTDHLGKILDCLNEPAVIGGPYLLAEDQNKISQLYQQLQEHHIQTGIRGPKKYLHLLGGNLIIHRDILAKYRFAEQIQFGSSETELLGRIALTTYPLILNSSIAVVHRPEMTPLKLLWKSFMQGLGYQFHIESSGKDQNLVFRQLDFQGTRPLQLLMGLTDYNYRLGQAYFAKTRKMTASPAQYVSFLFYDVFIRRSLQFFVYLNGARKRVINSVLADLDLIKMDSKLSFKNKIPPKNSPKP